LKAAAALPALTGAAKGEPIVPAAATIPGTPMRPYGAPSRYEDAVKRILTPGYPDISPGTGSSRTPIHLLDGIVTPSGLHYERHHNGVPDIDPAKHRLLVHGLVARPLEFTIDALLRYPRVSRLMFLECAGNSSPNVAPVPPQTSAGAIHGLLSCSEWTCVPLRHILDEAGRSAGAKWIIAEGGDASGLERSIPLEAAYRNGLLTLFQNGERLRPEQGYPVRLLMPGWEGNLNVKWLQRLKLADGPVYSKEETSKYTELQKDGMAREFDFIMPVKSVILRPSVSLHVPQLGYYEISGVAWSGHGRIRKVEITTDGGNHWVKARLPDPALPQCLTRFRLDWNWDGAPALLQSRATDELGHTQPTRTAWLAQFAPGQGYHQNMIQSWQVEKGGTVRNVYA
jgi:sulfane dehydrogenase subunit SoxC